jgi:hypothetical protein
MAGTIWWLRIVGFVYVLNGIMMAVVRAPITAAGPDGALARAAAGDPTARFLVDTWVGFGADVAAVGVGLLAASRSPATARALVWTIIAIELMRGLAYDVYMLARGYPPAVYLPWIAIHVVIIATGLMVLNASGSRVRRPT